MASIDIPQTPGQRGPAWDIARLYPDQGTWDEGEYLLLTERTNRLVELTNGFVEVLAMPKQSHQLIVAFLYRLLSAFVAPNQLGQVLFAPLRVRLRDGVFREPDVVFMLREHGGRMGEDSWDGADLVVEVVSDDPESRERDLIRKPREYAHAGIPEYWIVDPRDGRVQVLSLSAGSYAIHSEGRSGGTVSSRLLHGFEVEVAAVLAAGARE